MNLTWRKSVSAAAGDELIVHYDYADLGVSLGDCGIDPSNLTISSTPQVKVDADENRYVYADNIDTEGFDVYGGQSGDDAPYNLRISIEFF